jgi:hypothetical protein
LLRSLPMQIGIVTWTCYDLSMKHGYQGNPGFLFKKVNKYKNEVSTIYIYILSRLWISIFDNKRLSEVYYELSNTMIREHVQVSGRGRHVFRCCFPFSWLIKELIDELWRGASDVSSK